MANKLWSAVQKGTYSGATAYTVGDFVSYNGSSYTCILNSTGNLPTNATYWALIASKGDTGATGNTGATGATGPTGPAGPMDGPSSSADGELPLFDSTTGKLLKRSNTLTGVVRVDNGVVSVDSDVTDIVAAASTTAAGKVELAITSEIDTGTDSTRAMPIDQFVASTRNVRYVLFRVKEKATDWDADGTTAVGGDLVIPFTGTIVDIEADVDTAGTTGTAIVDVNLNGSTIMTTNKLKWDSTEKSTRTYSGTAPGLTTTAVTAGDIITVDIDTNHTTKSKGLTVFLAIRLT